MLEKKTCVEFQNSGLLWWINRSLHLFGWAIVIEDNEMYPARCKYRGFSEKVEDNGFHTLTQYLVDNANELNKEVN